MYEEIILSKLKKIKTGVGDTVEGIQDIVNNLSKSFTNWSKDWTPSRAAKLDNLDASVSSVEKKVENINNKTQELLLSLNESKQIDTIILSVANDILLGGKVADWVADLKKSGKTSETYSNLENMTILCATSSACLDTSINAMLFDYAITNNLNIGKFFGAIIGAVDGVVWDTLTTISSVTANTAAFTAITKSMTAFKLLMSEPKANITLYNNRSVTQPILATRTDVIMTVLKSFYKINTYYTAWSKSKTFTDIVYVMDIYIDEGSTYKGGTYTGKLSNDDGVVKNYTVTTDYHNTDYSENYRELVDNFATRIELKAGGGWLYAYAIKLG